jgi:2'-5' RNA ligase
MKDKVRLFIGVKASMDAVQEMDEVARQMRTAAEEAGVKVRWASPATYHVTLKFIGWTRREAIGAIKDEVARVVENERAFEFQAVGAGAFPSVERARVLWIGVEEPTGAMARMATGIDRALASLGYKPEKRAFHPHITLGRLKEFANVRPVLQPWTEHKYRSTAVDSVILYESILSPDGAEYPVRLQWPLRPTKASKDGPSGDQRAEVQPESAEEPEPVG